MLSQVRILSIPEIGGCGDISPVILHFFPQSETLCPQNKLLLNFYRFYTDKMKFYSKIRKMWQRLYILFMNSQYLSEIQGTKVLL